MRRIAPPPTLGHKTHYDLQPPSPRQGQTKLDCGLSESCGARWRQYLIVDDRLLGALGKGILYTGGVDSPSLYMIQQLPLLHSPHRQSTKPSCIKQAAKLLRHMLDIAGDPSILICRSSLRISWTKSSFVIRKTGCTLKRSLVAESRKGSRGTHAIMITTICRGSQAQNTLSHIITTMTSIGNLHAACLGIRNRVRKVLQTSVSLQVAGRPEPPLTE